MVVDVAPVLRLPRSLGVFSYTVPKDLEHRIVRGAWVTAPFRGRVTGAIVLSVRTTQPDRALLPLHDVTETTLTETQLRLAETLADASAISLGHAFFTILPQRPKRKGAAAGENDAKERFSLPRARHHGVIADMQALLQRPERTAFLSLRTTAERLVAAAEAVRLFPDKQVLLVTPTKREAMRFASVLRQAFGRRTLLLLDEQPRAVFWSNWNAVRSQQDAVLVTTRVGLFAPMSNLGLVLFDLDTDPAHAQVDQNPRYHARDLALALCQLTSARFVALDSVPSLSLFANLPSKPAVQPLQQQRVVLDRSQDPPGSRHWPLAERALELLRGEGPHLLFLNRKGFARVFRCRDCDWEQPCSRCGIPVQPSGDGMAICPSCGATERQVAACPRCSGTRFTMRGMGADRLLRSVGDLLPDRSVVRLDAEHAALSEEADVIVATEKILHLPHLPRFRSVVIVRFEQLLHHADFRTAERAFGLVERLCTLAAPNASIVLQTSNPDQPVVRALASGDPEPFYRSELAVRAALGLPPAAPCVRLFSRRPAAEPAEFFRDAAPAIARRVGPVNGAYIVHGLPDERSRATLRECLRGLPDPWLVDPLP